MSDSFTVKLDGVEVGFKTWSSGQLIMAQKILRDAKKRARVVGEDLAFSEMIVELLDIIEHTVIDPGHVDHMVNGMSAGTINAPEIMTILRQGRTETTPDDDADPVVKPRANKTRTKKN